MFLTPREAVGDDEIVAVLDWTRARESPSNREFLSYARAHGLLVEESGAHRSLVVTTDKVFLASVSAATLQRRLGPNIVSPPGGVC